MYVLVLRTGLNPPPHAAHTAAAVHDDDSTQSFTGNQACQNQAREDYHRLVPEPPQAALVLVVVSEAELCTMS